MGPEGITTIVCTTGHFERRVIDGIDVTTHGDGAYYGLPTALEQLREWLDEVELATGSRPRKLRIPPRAWREIRRDPDLVERLKYVDNTESGYAQFVAQLLGLDRIELIRAAPADSGGEIIRS